jgi:hypothetical protein
MYVSMADAIFHVHAVVVLLTAGLPGDNPNLTAGL